MKHRLKQRKLNRTPSHHKAMQRNLAQSMIEHGQVRTTVQKAKDLRPFMEKLVSLARSARQGSITARRQIHKLLSDRSIIPADRREEYEDMSLAKRAKVLRARSGRRYRTGAPKGKLPFTGESVTHRLLNSVAERFEERPGGYTRLIKLAQRRVGDGGELAILQFVGDEEAPGSVTRPAKTARKRRADSRYALAVKLAKQRRGGKPEASEAPSKPEAAAEPAGAAEGEAAEGEQKPESSET